MRKYRAVVLGSALTFLWILLLLIRGLRRGVLVRVGGWTSLQLIAVCIGVLLISAVCLLLCLRSRKGKVIGGGILLLLTVILVLLGIVVQPFAQERYTAQVGEESVLIFTRLKNLQGYIYGVYRQDGPLLARKASAAISFSGNPFRTGAYTVEEENGIYVLSYHDQSQAQQTCPLPEQQTLSRKESARFFLNGYTLLYAAFLIRMLVSERRHYSIQRQNACQEEVL